MTPGCPVTLIIEEKRMNKHAAAAFILLCPVVFLWNPGRFAQAEETKPIRVGIIRCDTHGMYFGPLLGRHDPWKLRDPLKSTPGPQRYTWQSGGSHFSFYGHYYQQDKMTVPFVEGFEVVKVWDEFPDAAECASNVFLQKPQVCKTFEEVSDGVDLVIIGDANLDGSDHLRLAAPGLAKGIPTFVDKPFAANLRDAKAIVDLARKHDTPVLSLSMLRVLPEARLMINRFPEIAPVQFGVIRGGWKTLAAQIHALSLAQLLFGAGVEEVECMGASPLAYIHLSYGGRQDRPEDGVMILCASGKSSTRSQYFASAYSENGVVHSSPLNHATYPYGAVEIIQKMKEMAWTRKPPVPYEEMLELIAIVDAARVSQKERRPVRLKEITAE
jgi:predicted dehydrogenase